MMVKRLLARSIMVCCGLRWGLEEMMSISIGEWLCYGRRVSEEVAVRLLTFSTIFSVAHGVAIDVVAKHDSLALSMVNWRRLGCKGA
jgi:hypothetical protein